MARKSSGFKLPSFKWVLFYTLIIALPLTLFALNNVSTTTEQHAAGYTCGPSNQNPSCPANYACSYIQGNPTFGGTCYTLAKSTGLKSGAWYCKWSTDPNEYDSISFSWNKVNGVTQYTLYYKLYGNDINGKPYPIYTTIIPQSTYNTIVKLIQMKNNHGRNVQWYVVATNGFLSSRSITAITPTAYFSCQ